MKKNVLIIGAGGVAQVVAHKCAQNNDVLGDLQRRRDEVDQQQRLVQFRTRRFDQPEQEDQALLDFYRSLGQKPPQGSTDIPNPEPR